MVKEIVYDQVTQKGRENSTLGATPLDADSFCLTVMKRDETMLMVHCAVAGSILVALIESEITLNDMFSKAPSMSSS